jgi:hypothetical protein
MLIDVLVLGLDLQHWFGEDGILPAAAARAVVDPDTRTLLDWLPHSPAVLHGCLGLLLGHLLLLLIGWYPRVQAACAFVWFTSFVHRNILIFDGEDTLLRLLLFFLAFVPSGERYALAGLWRRTPRPAAAGSMWGLRMIQIQMSLIYLSAAWEKARGEDWVSGNALYYVARLDDLFGHLPVPAFLFESPAWFRPLTRAVMVLEFLLPAAFWFRETRRVALLVALGFHLALAWSMNLFLFQWAMIVGLVSFTEEEDWRLLWRSARRLVGRAG